VQTKPGKRLKTNETFGGFFRSKVNKKIKFIQKETAWSKQCF
jgi:hypothetical protein